MYFCANTQGIRAIHTGQGFRRFRNARVNCELSSACNYISHNDYEWPDPHRDKQNFYHYGTESLSLHTWGSVAVFT